MSDDEIFVFIASVVVGALAMGGTSTAWLHRLAMRGRAGAGLVRLSVWASMGWLLYVLNFHADPSVTGVYFWFYVVMGFAVVKAFGQWASSCFGIRFREDVCERGNLAAAVYVAGFTLATGLIFGGCLWGEADPNGDGEGGWWIPVGFFLSGWGSLVVATSVFLWREPGPTRRMIRNGRRMGDATAAAFYMLGVAWVMTEAVAGDFYGWINGLVPLFALTGMMITHEVFLLFTGRMLGEKEGGIPPARPWRVWEGLGYLVWGGAGWALQRWLVGMVAG